jgi:hypothetical protein
MLALPLSNGSKPPGAEAIAVFQYSSKHPLSGGELLGAMSMINVGRGSWSSKSSMPTRCRGDVLFWGAFVLTGRAWREGRSIAMKAISMLHVVGRPPLLRPLFSQIMYQESLSSKACAIKLTSVGSRKVVRVQESRLAMWIQPRAASGFSADHR